jgi:hypothetical protein
MALEKEDLEAIKALISEAVKPADDDKKKGGGADEDDDKEKS